MKAGAWRCGKSRMTAGGSKGSGINNPHSLSPAHILFWDVENPDFPLEEDDPRIQQIWRQFQDSDEAQARIIAGSTLFDGHPAAFVSVDGAQHILRGADGEQIVGSVNHVMIRPGDDPTRWIAVGVEY